MLTKQVAAELSRGNIIAFPEKETHMMVVLNREDLSNKFFQVYDVRKNGYVRRVNKKSSEDETMAVDDMARSLAYADGAEICLQSVKVPNSASLVDMLAPRFQVAESKLNPAQAAEDRQKYKDTLYRDLHNYHLFRIDPIRAAKLSGMTGEQNAHLMVTMYNEACA